MKPNVVSFAKESGGQNGSKLLNKSIDAQIEFPDFKSFTYVENAIQSKFLPIRCEKV